MDQRRRQYLGRLALFAAGKINRTLSMAGFFFWSDINTGIYLQSFIIKGGLAHLVERKHGMFEVTGSIPVSSTKPVNFRMQS
jgi:hypothetical protein